MLDLKTRDQAILVVTPGLVAYGMFFNIAPPLIGLQFALRVSPSALQRPRTTEDSNMGDLVLPTYSIAAAPSSLDQSLPLISSPSRQANISHLSPLSMTGVTSIPSGGSVLQTTVIKCDGSTYGFDLNTDSCMEAWGLLPQSTRSRTFGQRTGGHFDVPLPFRLLSCERSAATESLTPVLT